MRCALLLRTPDEHWLCRPLGNNSPHRWQRRVHRTSRHHVRFLYVRLSLTSKRHVRNRANFPEPIGPDCQVDTPGVAVIFMPATAIERQAYALHRARTPRTGPLAAHFSTLYTPMVCTEHKPIMFPVHLHIRTPNHYPRQTATTRNPDQHKPRVMHGTCSPARTITQAHPQPSNSTMTKMKGKDNLADST